MNYKQNYEKWLLDFAFDTESINELKAIINDEKEIEDRFYQNLSFGTAGMRGILGAGINRMNLYTVAHATQGLANYLCKQPDGKERGVAIAYDSRLMSTEFAMETALVLCANGIKTYLFDALRPVALLSFGMRFLNAKAGVVITASHNPPQYNGYKVYGEDGAQLGPDEALSVTTEINALSLTQAKKISKEEAEKSGLLIMIGKEIDDEYTKRVKTLSINPDIVKEMGKDLKIVYTPLHGSGNIPVRRVLKEIGISNVSVVKEQENPDPYFSTIKLPNPEDPTVFKMAIELANKVGADVIFGTDPDCDRLGVALKESDGQFRLLTGNQIGCLMLYYILSCKQKQGTLPKNGAVCKSIVSTELASAICKHFNVTLFNTLTGFKFIGEKIQEFEDTGSYSFLFGFEESYGYLSSTFVRDKDGINASLLIAEAAAYYLSLNKTLSNVMEEIFNTFGYYLEHVQSTTLPGLDGIKVMKEIMNKVRQNPPTQIGGIAVERVLDILTGTETVLKTGEVKQLEYPTSDVLYFAMEGGHFVCLRPSGTEPKIKLYINANHKEKKEAEKLITILSESAQDLLK